MSDEIRAEITNAAKALCHYPSGPSSVCSCCQGIPRCEMGAAIAEIARLRAALATARREGMEMAAKKADAIARRFRVELPEKWKARPGGIPKDWMDTWEACAETAEEIATAIRAAAEEDRQP